MALLGGGLRGGTMDVARALVTGWWPPRLLGALRSCAGSLGTPGIAGVAMRLCGGRGATSSSGIPRWMIDTCVGEVDPLVARFTATALDGPRRPSQALPAAPTALCAFEQTAAGGATSRPPSTVACSSTPAAQAILAHA
jgi:hypothetical protein